MTEVALKINGKNVFEYETGSAPRVGEYLDISHEEICGHFKVTKVTQHIYQQKKDEKVITYLIVEAETTTPVNEPV